MYDIWATCLSPKTTQHISRQTQRQEINDGIAFVSDYQGFICLQNVWSNNWSHQIYVYDVNKIKHWNQTMWINIADSEEVKPSYCWDNFWTNQLFDQQSARHFPAAQAWSFEIIIDYRSMMSELVRIWSDMNLTGMPCAPVTGDWLHSGLAHLELAY